jgi:tryptophanyl-tRNA synthetase
VTDSDGIIAFDPENRAGVSNLLSIYAACMSKTAQESEAEFQGKGYGQLKQGVADAIIAVLMPIQAEYTRLLADKAQLDSVLASGAEKASIAGRKTLRKVYHKLGLDD